MKEIIYLDTEIMNSMLAQLDEGIVNSFTLEQSNQESETEGQQTIRGKSAGLSGSLNVNSGFFPGGGLSLGASLGDSGNESTSEARTILEGQKDILNKAFHDYALELLTKRLVEDKLLVDGPDFKEGDLFIGESSYRFYDFNLLKKAIDYNFIKDALLSEIDELDYEEAKKNISKKNITGKERTQMEKAQKIMATHKEVRSILKVFKQLNSLSVFASNLLEDLSVIKTINTIGLLKRKYLRESPESLSFRTDKSRKIKFLIRVIGKKEIVYDGFNIPQFQEEELDMIPNIMLDIILGSFKIIQKGDFIVTPIAIYYE
jgi:hypothetical protein